MQASLPFPSHPLQATRMLEAVSYQASLALWRVHDCIFHLSPARAPDAANWARCIFFFRTVFHVFQVGPAREETEGLIQLDIDIEEWPAGNWEALAARAGDAAAMEIGRAHV